MRKILTPTALLAVAALLLTAAPATLAKKKSFDEGIDLTDWVEGPVRYIARKPEVKAFKTLESDEQRALFIERFWYARDPNPDTLSNPYRHLFWERVKQANDNFVESSKPGWLTDRGKIHILYGAPNEIQEEFDLRTKDSIAGGGTGLYRWLYDRPAGRMDMQAVVVVAFVRDGSGEYRLTYDPNLTSVFFDAQAIRSADFDIGSRMRAESMGGGRSELSVMLDLGKMQEVPPEEQVLLERVETAEAYQMGNVDVRIDRFEHPDDDDGTVVVITIDISNNAPEGRPAIIARMAPVEAGQSMRLLGEDSFKIVESEDGIRLAQGRMTVAPGSYILTVMVADQIKVETSLHQSAVTIKGQASGLHLSDVVSVDALETLEFASLASYDEPFIVGPFRVVPKVDTVYRRGETVKLFYEIYEASAPVRVSYQLEGLESDGSWVGLGQPQVATLDAVSQGRSQGWEISTSERWPIGDYRIRISIDDASGESVVHDVPFELQEAPEG